MSFTDSAVASVEPEIASWSTYILIGCAVVQRYCARNADFLVSFLVLKAVLLVDGSGMVWCYLVVAPGHFFSWKYSLVRAWLVMY